MSAYVPIHTDIVTHSKFTFVTYSERYTKLSMEAIISILNTREVDSERSGFPISIGCV